MRKGQAMVEYVVVAGALTFVAFALAWFVHVAIVSAERTEVLVTQDCP